MSKILQWIKMHVCPHFKYNPIKNNEIDLKKDNPSKIYDKAKEDSEIGIKIKFKF